jgi:hypothetical protein
MDVKAQVDCTGDFVDVLTARTLCADGSYCHFRLVNGDGRCHTLGIRLQKPIGPAVRTIS